MPPPKFSPSTFWPNLLSLGGIIATVVLGYWSVRESMIEKIKEVKSDTAALLKQNSLQGTRLSQTQSEQLLNYHLKSLRIDLNEQTRTFFEQVYPTLIANRNYSAAENFVYNATNKTIVDHRSKLALFCIAPDKSLANFLDEVSKIDHDIISEAQQKVFEVFRAAIDEEIDTATAIAQAEGLIMEATKKTEKNVLMLLGRFY